jgi:hypothetical protein
MGTAICGACLLQRAVQVGGNRLPPMSAVATTCSGVQYSSTILSSTASDSVAINNTCHYMFLLDVEGCKYYRHLITAPCDKRNDSAPLHTQTDMQM